MILKRCLLLLLILSLFAPVGCEKAESTIVLLPYSQPSVDKKAIPVNISSKTVHFDHNCTHVKNAKEENLRSLDHTTDNINTLLSMGYTLCKTCRDPNVK